MKHLAPTPTTTSQDKAQEEGWYPVTKNHPALNDTADTNSSPLEPKDNDTVDTNSSLLPFEHSKELPLAGDNTQTVGQPTLRRSERVRRPVNRLDL